MPQIDKKLGNERLRSLMEKEKPQSEEEVYNNFQAEIYNSQREMEAQDEPGRTGAYDWFFSLPMFEEQAQSGAPAEHFVIPQAMIGLQERLLRSDPNMQDEGQFWNEQRFEPLDTKGLQEQVNYRNDPRTELNPFTALASDMPLTSTDLFGRVQSDDLWNAVYSAAVNANNQRITQQLAAMPAAAAIADNLDQQGMNANGASSGTTKQKKSGLSIGASKSSDSSNSQNASQGGNEAPDAEGAAKQASASSQGQYGMGGMVKDIFGIFEKIIMAAASGGGAD